MNEVVTDIIKNIRCLVCENQSVSESNSPFATDIKQFVEKSINEGLSKTDIFTILTEKYGDFILLSPKVSEYTILLWVLPIAVLILLFVLIIKKNNNKLNITKQKYTTKQKPINQKFIALVFISGIVFTIIIYNKIGSFGMGDYPQSTIIHYDNDKKIKLLIQKSRDWRSADGFDSPRVIKVLNQIINIDKNNTEANWFLAIYYWQNENKSQAKKYYKIAINSAKDIDTKQYLKSEWQKIINNN